MSETLVFVIFRNEAFAGRSISFVSVDREKAEDEARLRTGTTPPTIEEVILPFSVDGMDQFYTVDCQLYGGDTFVDDGFYFQTMKQAQQDADEKNRIKNYPNYARARPVNINR